MKQTIAIITAALTVVSAQSSKYIVANSYPNSGCTGKATVSSIETGKCYYAKEECANNPDLAPECEFLKAQSIGDDVSFIAECNGGKISAKAFNGKGCTDASKAVGTGSLSIPVSTCLLNFQLVCSDNSKFKIPTASNDNAASALKGGILGLFGLLFV